jgi:hypothetical protein
MCSWKFLSAPLLVSRYNTCSDSYTITNTLHDAPHEQAYREEIRLVGDDGAEGVTAELLPTDAIWDGVVDVPTSPVPYSAGMG